MLYFLKQPEKEDIPSFKLLTMGENVKRTSRIPPIMTLGGMSKKMAAKSSFIMQRIVPHKDDIILAGAAIIKGKTNKMLGFLGKEETEGLNWLSGKGKGGIVEAIDKETKEMIIYEIKNIKSKMIPKVENGEISFDVKIESEGKLSEDWLVTSDAFDEKFIKRAEKTIEDEVMILVNKAIEKTQKEFKVDVSGFGKILSIKYPKVWEEVKDNWDETFSDVPINVDLKIYIRTFGKKGKK
ncbi:MAG: Ger(x)C family spore germination protein [Firmicutes bacterium]|nr:Ger(x)C family spore germination protein [Bacillota bacterium]